MFYFNYKTISLDHYLFNPEAFNCLFVEDEINKLKINCETAFFSFNNDTFFAFKFNIERIKVERLTVDFQLGVITESNRNQFFLLLLDNNVKVKEVVLRHTEFSIYNNLINVSKIDFVCFISIKNLSILNSQI